MIEPQTDLRYRVLVHLNRTDQPTVWTFHCPRCTMPVCEITNSVITALTDLIDGDNTGEALSGVRCDGRYNGGKCSIWYYMQVGSA